MTLSEKLQIKQGSARLLGAIYFLFFASGMMSTYFGAVLPAITKEYLLTYTTSGLILSFHQVGSFVAVILAGFMPYLIGRKRSTVYFASGIVVGLILFTVTGNPALLLFAALCTGVGRGTISNITNVVIAENVGNKTAGLNLLHAFFSVGAMLGPLLALISISIDVWRASALMIAFIMGLALIFIQFSTLSTVPQQRVAKTPDNQVTSSFWKSSSFWLVVMILFFYVCAEASFMGWLVTYFTDTGKVSKEIAPSISSLLWLMILIGRLSVAALSTKIRKKLLLVILSISMLFFFIVMTSAQTTMLTILGVLGVGLSMAGIYPTALSTLDNAFNSSTVATGTCIAVATVGGILMPAIIGAVAEQSGINAGIMTIAGALVILIILSIIKFLSKNS